MSISIMRKVWEMDCGTHTAKLVLLCIADHMSKEGDAWPSVSTIARRCGLTRRAVMKNVAILKGRGVLEASKQAGKSTRYRLKLVNEDHQSLVNEVHGCISITSERGSPPLVNEVPKLVNEVHPNHIEPPFEPPREPVGDPPKKLPHGKKFAAAWEKWERHRREIRKPLRPTMIETQLAKFGEMSETAAVLMIENSVCNGWQGLFPVKDQNGSPKTPPPKFDL